jgi:hypothetical protein
VHSMLVYDAELPDRMHNDVTTLVAWPRHGLWRTWARYVWLVVFSWLYVGCPTDLVWSMPAVPSAQPCLGDKLAVRVDSASTVPGQDIGVTLLYTGETAASIAFWSTSGAICTPESPSGGTDAAMVPCAPMVTFTRVPSPQRITVIFRPSAAMTPPILSVTALDDKGRRLDGTNCPLVSPMLPVDADAGDQDATIDVVPVPDLDADPNPDDAFVLPAADGA